MLATRERRLGMKWKISLFEPDFGPTEARAVQAPLESGWLAMGKTTAALEQAFAERCGVEHAVAVTNGTAALHLALWGSGVGPGDEVICPTLTFVATANAIRYVDATPVFCESRSESNLNADPDDIAERITDRTRAIMVVHYAGFPADMPRILELANAHDLIVLEDCAHALFSTIHARSCGGWGRAAAFSFFSNKNMTCGEGGMVTTNDSALAERFRQARSHGMTSVTFERHGRGGGEYDVISDGFNYRLDELRSGLALAQLQRLDGFLDARRRVRGWYEERLADSAVVVPDFDWARISLASDTVGPHIMPVLLPEDCGREDVISVLRDRGIQTSIHYRPVHRLTAYRRLVAASRRPIRTERLAARQLTLPMFPTMTRAQVDTVTDVLLAAIRRTAVVPVSGDNDE
jgi:dTDP-4-amino-4,6-dideoxygalactose transaminase